MQKNEKTKLKEIGRCIDITLGSSPKVIYSVYAQKANNSQHGTDYQNEYEVFDFTNNIPSDLLSSLNLDITELDRDRFISAHAPIDKASLTKTEEDGSMWVLDDNWLNDPGLFQDNRGGAGQPRCGFALSVFNSRKLQEKLLKAIRRVLDLAPQIEHSNKGIFENSQDSRIIVRIFFSAIGATGSGSVHHLLDGLVRNCAAEAGVEAKIVLCMVLRGNLSVQNLKKAKLNELATLKTIRVKSTGAYVNSITGIIEPVPFDTLYICSNINSGGNIISLDRLLCHEGQLNYFEQDTPGGSSLKERFCDIQGWEYAPNGDPECGFTRGMAILSRDSKRVIEYLGFFTGAILAQSCLAEIASENALEKMAALARTMKIVETEDENNASKSVLVPEEFAGENVSERAIASLSDRTANTSDFNRLLALQDAINSIINTDLIAIYEPVMREKAQKHIDRALEILGKNLHQLLKTPYGLSQTMQTLQAIRAVLEKSTESLSEKINELQEHLLPHEEIIAEISEHIQQLKQMNVIVRSFQTFTVRSMAQTLEESGRALINYNSELSACTIALQDLVMPLIDKIDNKSGWILAQVDKFRKVHQFCMNKAEQIVNQPTIFQAPVGHEITGRQFLQEKLDGYVQKAGGIEKFKHQLRVQFLNKYGSFAAFSQTSMKEIIEIFYSFCASMYEADIKETDVLDELFAAANGKILLEIFSKLMSQSDGRVLAEGQANEYIPRIKVASVPSEKHVEKVKNILENLETDSGKWQIVVNPSDKDTFSVVQVRGKLTLTQFIKRIDLPDTYENWKILIETAVDPVTAIMVGPEPNDRQLKRVLAKAIAAGLLIQTEKGFELKTFTGKTIILGDSDTAAETLRHKFRDIVFIESTFARNLVVDEDAVLAKLNSLLKDTENTPGKPDSPLSLIDTTAIRECLQQAELLLPRLRRMRKTSKRRIV